MIVTANALIARAMRLIKATAAGEAPTGAESADCLTALNAMVDSWLTERLTIPQVQRLTKALSANTQDYTIGTGGSINADRPNWIQNAGIIPAGLTAETPIAVLSDDEWAAIGIKSQTATFPEAAYYNYGYASGLGTISVWPIPTTAPTLVLYTPKAVLTSFATLAQDYYLPPGYERALAYNLAIEIADEFGKTIPPGIAMIASESKGNIKRANIRLQELGCDPGTLRRNSDGAAYNWRTDTFGARG